MDFLSSLIQIIIIDLFLSGDNAVVIGMAAHRLEPRQRKTAIILGGGAAIVLRIVLTAIAALLLQLSGLQLVGGILLIWIGVRLLAHEEESHEDVKVAGSMKEAVVTILVADFIMSLDNVLGVAGASHGNLLLLLSAAVRTDFQHGGADVHGESCGDSDQQDWLVVLRRSGGDPLDGRADDFRGLSDPPSCALADGHARPSDRRHYGRCRALFRALVLSRTRVAGVDHR
jgi:YjbE family integral membrane protein